jgi:RsiW-degrading membrane proteinase PrsW (M82 family)/rRNA maturation protein Nop10
VLYGPGLTKSIERNDVVRVLPILGLVPGLLWLLYFHRKPGRNKRSFGNVARVFLWGCACTVPTFIVENITGAGLHQDTLVRSAEASFLLIGPIEEFFKLVAVWIAIYRTSDFQEPIDGIVYAATAALGFASVENTIYMGLLGPAIVVPRALFATPAHVMFASMWGYSMGLARFRRDGELLTIAKGFITAASLHGFYNFLVAVYPGTAMLSLIPLMGFMGWLMNYRIQEFRRNYPFPPLGVGALIACPNCGAYTLENSDKCGRCGFAIPLLESDAPRFCGRCRAQLDPCRDTCARCGEQASLARLCPPAT